MPKTCTLPCASPRDPDPGPWPFRAGLGAVLWPRKSNPSPGTSELESENLERNRILNEQDQHVNLHEKTELPRLEITETKGNELKQSIYRSSGTAAYMSLNFRLFAKERWRLLRAVSSCNALA